MTTYTDLINHLNLIMTTIEQGQNPDTQVPHQASTVYLTQLKTVRRHFELAALHEALALSKAQA